MREHQSVLARLGTSEEAAKVRAKMQSTSLLSDMQAFKVWRSLFRGSRVIVYCLQAANPGCLLDDFVRWYSPRDWIESDEDDCTSPSPPAAGGVAEEEPDTSEDVSGRSEHGGVANDGEVQEGEGVMDDKEEGPDQKGEGPPSGLAVRDEEEEEGEGWGPDDWDMVVREIEDVESDSARDGGGGAVGAAKRVCLRGSPYRVSYIGGTFLQLVRGHLSERMLQSDNVWMETWQLATPLPAYRQKKLFDDTKEAEKVLHHFANLTPSELAMQLTCLLLHSALDRLHERLSQQTNARVEGMLVDVVALLAAVQQPSLDTLPLYQVYNQKRLVTIWDTSELNRQ